MMSWKKRAPNTACTRLGVGPAFFELFLALADSRFEGDSTLPPQAGNAHRWAFVFRNQNEFGNDDDWLFCFS